jgi:hypothetical protein
MSVELKERKERTVVEAPRPRRAAPARPAQAKRRTRLSSATNGRASRPKISLASLAGKSAMFAVITFIAFSGSSLAGHVLVEQARRDALRSQERARDARAAETALRQRVELATSGAGLDEWALEQGFVPADQIVPYEEQAYRVAARH